MKILFIGLGSIGQRHVRIVRSVMGDQAELFSIKKRGAELIIDPPEARECESVADHYGLKEFPDLPSALVARPDVAFVCNPTSMHLATALECARNGVHVFIEKPVGIDADALSALQGVAQKNKVNVCVGYQTRFDPLVETVQQILAGPHAHVVSARFHWMTYLPQHHPYEDYRAGYAAREDLGGGVTFCLSHELDLMAHLFGVPTDVYAVQGTQHALDMAVDTSVSALFRYSGVRPEATFPVQLQLSFAQGKERRGFSIELSDAVIEADFVRRSLDYIPHTVRPARSWDFTDTTRDMLFAKQCRHVLEEVCQKGQKPVVSLDDAGISLVMALSVHKSLMSQMVEKILPINQHD